MEYILQKIAQLLKIGLLFLIGYFSVILIFGKSGAGLQAFQDVFDVISVGGMWLVNEIIEPIITWFLSIPMYFIRGEGSNLSPFPLIITWVVTLPLAFIGIITTLMYFPLVLIMFPIWTMADPKMAKVWAMYINPFTLIPNFTIPFMAEMQNMMRMESKDPVIKQMAVNDDLADRINKKVSTKQEIADRLARL